MSGLTDRFSPELEARFLASRAAALSQVNGSVFYVGLAASLVMLFSVWDWLVDPAAWATAFAIRLTAVAVIAATGVVQRLTRTVRWAPVIAKLRFSTGVLAVAGANAVVQDGYLVGLAGLVCVFLGGPYIVTGGRDYLLTTMLPLSVVALIMVALDLDRFVVINAWMFLSLTLVVGFMLARVFEATNRRAFALEQALKREARTDALTRLPNRRSMEETALAELRRQGRSGRPTALIICDVDHFKRINDDHGHDVGDRTIQAVGEKLTSVIRGTDTLGRWGGEEFLAILPETTAEEAAALAERMRAATESVRLDGAPDLRVTMSLGVASATPDGTAADASSLSPLLKLADDALYRAKAAGRNRVVVARQVDEVTVSVAAVHR
jgi:diguanylate cyclase (GGDEF)-like protein